MSQFCEDLWHHEHILPSNSAKEGLINYCIFLTLHFLVV